MARSSPGPRWETPDPPGVVGSYGPRVRKWAKRRLGITFGRWQAHAIDQALRYDKAGDVIARIILLSTARQNGKSVIVRALVGWMLEEGQYLPAFSGWSSILAAAHDAKQARVIYANVWMDFLALDVPEYKVTEWRGIRAGHLIFDTVTGQPGSVRGWSAGMIDWDEMLTQKDWDMWEALAPTQSAQRSPIMLLTSTAGHIESVVLRAFYDRLRRVSSGDEKADPTFYGAWWESEDPDAGLDWRQIAQANPALGDGRLTRPAIQSEYRVLPPDSWRRERLNHFVDAVADGAFNPGIWAALRTAAPLAGLDGPYALAVDVQPGWQRATISVAGIRTDGRVGVEVLRDLRDEPGNPVTAARIIAALEAFPEYVAVILFDSISGVSAELRRRGIETGLPYQELNRGQFVEACMDVTEMIHAGRLAVDDPLLDAQLPMVARRDVGADGAFCFSRGNSLGPIDAFLSMTFAAHGIASMVGTPRVI